VEADAEEHHADHGKVDVIECEGHGAEAAEDVEGGGDVGRAEEDPGEADEVEGNEDAEVLAPLGWSTLALDFLSKGLEDAEGGEADAVEESPEDERPADAVPEAAEEKHDDGVEVGGTLPAVGVGERGVDVVAEPVGEGDVPAAPEVGDVDGLVGAVEVVGDGEAEEEAEAHGDVGVAGEVEVDLEGVGVDADQDFGSAVEGRGVEDAVGYVVGEEVGDEEFFDQAGGDEEEGSAPLRGGEGKGLLKLLDEVGDPR
jgi:hypothetical protein